MMTFILTCYFFSDEPEFPEFTLAQRKASRKCAMVFGSRELCRDAERKLREAFFTNDIGVVTSCEAAQQTKPRQ
jgi:hypothetical protein